MQSFSDFIKESGMSHDIPPCHDVQTWIAENRFVFHNKDGKSDGERFLMGESWKRYNNTK